MQFVSPEPTCLVVGNPKAARQIVWIHGYTGSRSAFLPIATKIAQSFDAQVLLPLMPGHETQEADLLGLPYDTLFHSVRSQVLHALRADTTRVCVGYSFGGYFAASLAAEIAARGLVLALTPFVLRLPFSIRGIPHLFSLRPMWKKYLNAQDMQDRRGTFFYRHTPGHTFRFIHRGNTELRDVVQKLTMPLLMLYADNDPLVSRESGVLLKNLHGNPFDELHIIPNTRHALFFRSDHAREEAVLMTFLKLLFEKESRRHELSHDGDRNLTPSWA